MSQNQSLVGFVDNHVRKNLSCEFYMLTFILQIMSSLLIMTAVHGLQSPNRGVWQTFIGLLTLMVGSLQLGSLSWNARDRSDNKSLSSSPDHQTTTNFMYNKNLIFFNFLPTLSFEGNSSKNDTVGLAVAGIICVVWLNSGSRLRCASPHLYSTFVALQEEKL